MSSWIRSTTGVHRGLYVILVIGFSGVTAPEALCQYTTYERNYYVSTTTVAQLVEADGTSAFNPGKSYLVRGVVTNTGTDTGAVAFFRGIGATFILSKLYEAGTSSNHIEFFLDAQGAPSIRVYDHSLVYTVAVVTEEIPNKGRTAGPELNLYGDSVGNISIGSTDPNLWGFSSPSVTRFLTLSADQNQSNSSAFLQVVSKGTSTASVNFGNESRRWAAVGGLDGGALGLYVNPDLSNSWLLEAMRIAPSGQIGIGAAPDLSFSLHVRRSTPTWSTLIENGGAKAFLAHSGGYGLYLDAGAGADGATYALDVNKQDLSYLRVTGDGLVGIRTTAPAAELHVNGDAIVSGIITGGVVGAHYQDLAEWVPASADLMPGTVVELDRGLDNTVRAARDAYSTIVAGVVSPQPGLILGEAGEGKEMIATTGRVRVRVSAVNGAIARGDILVSSDLEGVAMRSTPVDVSGIEMHRPGTIIGKALEPLPEGEGEILVLLSLQ